VNEETVKQVAQALAGQLGPKPETQAPAKRKRPKVYHGRMGRFGRRAKRQEPVVEHERAAEMVVDAMAEEA